MLTTVHLTSQADIFGVANSCTWSNDVYQPNAAIGEAVEGAFYVNAGLNGPYVSDVVKPATALCNWIAVTSGCEIEHLLSRYCDTGNGRLAYYYLYAQRGAGTSPPPEGSWSSTPELRKQNERSSAHNNRPRRVRCPPGPHATQLVGGRVPAPPVDYCFLYSGRTGLTTGCFANSDNDHSIAFSSCGSRPSTPDSGVFSTSKSGSTPWFSIIHLPSVL